MADGGNDASVFVKKVQTLLLQQEFMQAIRTKEVAKVKEILCNPELDINYLYTYPGSEIEVIENI